MRISCPSDSSNSSPEGPEVLIWPLQAPANMCTPIHTDIINILNLSTLYLLLGWVLACHSVHVEVKGQLWGVGSLLTILSCGLKDAVIYMVRHPAQPVFSEDWDFVLPTTMFLALCVLRTGKVSMYAYPRNRGIWKPTLVWRLACSQGSEQ